MKRVILALVLVVATVASTFAQSPVISKRGTQIGVNKGGVCHLLVTMSPKDMRKATKQTGMQMVYDKETYNIDQDIAYNDDLRQKYKVSGWVMIGGGAVGSLGLPLIGTGVFVWGIVRASKGSKYKRKVEQLQVQRTLN
jgi:hypothetical protein